jgi:hypothetical protein
VPVWPLNLKGVGKMTFPPFVKITAAAK